MYGSSCMNVNATSPSHATAATRAHTSMPDWPARRTTPTTAATTALIATASTMTMNAGGYSIVTGSNRVGSRSGTARSATRRRPGPSTSNAPEKASARPHVGARPSSRSCQLSGHGIRARPIRTGGPT